MSLLFLRRRACSFLCQPSCLFSTSHPASSSSIEASSIFANTSLWRPGRGYINGEWTTGSSKGEFGVKNPATGGIIASLPKMTASDVNDAADVAFRVWNDSWKSSTPAQRSAILMKMYNLMIDNVDDLGKIITLEAGKPFSESKGEILYAASMYKFFAEEARRSYGTIIPSNIKGRSELVFKQSIGPAALITPWNFPSAMVTRKVGAALAAGCSVVIKPSEETPMSALALCAIAEEAGLPAGVMNCLTVDRPETVDVGNAMCHSNKFRKLSFTGSTNVGKLLMRECASTVKKVSMELGGNAPFIVFNDADMDIAIKALLASKFRNAGQACIASNRILVQSKIYDEFADRFSTKVSRLKLGYGLDDGVTMGPVINKQGLEKISRQVEDCKNKGGKIITMFTITFLLIFLQYMHIYIFLHALNVSGSVLCGGSESENLNKTGGTFFRPTVIRDVTLDTLPAVEETFGPMAPLMMFEEEEEAISIANDSPYGLAAYACTNDLGRAFRLADQIETGMLGINEGAISQDSTPFGGIKESGLGKEGSFLGMDEYMESKFVCMGGLAKS